MKSRWLSRICLLALLVCPVVAEAAWTQLRITILDPHGKPFSGARLGVVTGHVTGYDADANLALSYLGPWWDADSAGNVRVTLDSLDRLMARPSPNGLGRTLHGLAFDSLDIQCYGYFPAGQVLDTTAWKNLRVRTSFSYVAGSFGTPLTRPNVGDSLYSDTLILDYDWKPSPAEEDSGISIFRGVPYQIVYDPPGDQSSASLTIDSTFSTSVTTSFGTSTGATLAFGYAWENPLTNSGIEAEVSASVNYKHNKDDNFTATISRSSALGTSGAGDNPEGIGPGRGDVYVCPTLKMRWHLYRAYAPRDSFAYTDGYVYKIFYRLLDDPESPMLTTTASELPRIVTDSASLRMIQEASVIDPVTHRIRSSLLDRDGQPKTDRLVRVPQAPSEITGGSSNTENSSESVTRSTTITQNLDIGVTASLKVKAFGGSESYSLSVGVSLGGSRTGTTVAGRLMSYTFQESTPWDFLKFKVYLDKAYGVYVFDVDSSQSWSSFPFESGYSTPSVRMGILADRDTLVLEPGVTDTFRLTVSNASRGGYESLDTLHAVSASVKVNSGAEVATPAGIWNLGRGASQMFKVAAGAAQPGIYPVEVAFSGTVGGKSYEQIKPLTLVVGPDPSRIGRVPASGPRLSGDLRSLQVRCDPEQSWSLRIHDLQGRPLLVVQGKGNRTVELPRGNRSLTLQELQVDGGPSIRRLGLSLP